MQATKLRALAKKQAAMPRVAITRPARAGPTMRETLLTVLPTPTAPVMSSGPTISYMKAERTGVSNEFTVPMSAASTKRLQTSMVSVATMTPEHARQEPGEHLGGLQHVPAAAPVGDGAGDGPEDQHRQELRGGDEAEEAAAAGELQDQPAHGDGLHPGAGLRDRLATEVEPEVAVAEGREPAAVEPAHSAPTGPVSAFPPDGDVIRVIVPTPRRPLPRGPRARRGRDRGRRRRTSRRHPARRAPR